MDEADTYLSPRVAANHEGLRGLVNAGHRRGAKAYRSEGREHTPTPNEAFAAVAVAGIGDLPGTILDRSVIVLMRRRSPREEVAPVQVQEGQGGARADPGRACQLGCPPPDDRGAPPGRTCDALGDQRPG
jgi:hypothetical protein